LPTQINLGHVAIGFLIACFNATQSRVNGQLGHVVGNGVLAALCSFSSGWVILLIIALLVPNVRKAFIAIPGLVRNGTLKWWQCIGGMAGATYVIGQGTVVPVVGVAIFTISVVAGQTASSLLVDKYGLGPAGPKAITWVRIIAAVFAIIGVGISVTGRDNSGTFSLPLILYAFATGLLTAAQYALNGRVGVATGQPFATTLLNFTMGTVVLVFALAFMVFAQGVKLYAPPSPLVQPWLWSGGTIGIIFIASASILVRSLGVLVFALVSVVGQLTGALLLDFIWPTPGTEVGFQIVSGVLITAVAVVIASLPTRAREVNQ
jgi:transporter family-2 protein